MLRSLKAVRGYSLQAADGAIGSAVDFYFDDASWTVRYLVADTGRWLPGRRVLISPASLGRPDWAGRSIPVELSRKQIEESPGIEADKPVSRQRETEMARYFHWPAYWSEMGAPPLALSAMPARYRAEAERERTAVEEKPGDPHLRSAREVLGYAAQAQDGRVGPLDDFIFEDDNWSIRYLVVDTRNWRPGGEVLVSPEWVRGVRWDAAQIQLDLTRDQVRSSPAFDPSAPINREYEAKLYDFYGRPRYWR